jgi:hypothetical protein
MVSKTRFIQQDESKNRVATPTPSKAPAPKKSGTVAKIEPRQLAVIQDGLEIWEVSLTDLKEQDKNARVMDPTMFKRLVENIKHDSRLESLPFVSMTQAEDKPPAFEVISGHHRLRAARTAGLDRVAVLVDTTGMNRSQLVSKQLAHNAIQGDDDVDMLAALFSEMESVVDILASAIDPETIGADKIGSVGIERISLNMVYTTLVFQVLPTQLEDLNEIMLKIPDKAEVVGFWSQEVYEEFEKSARRLGRQYDIRAVGAIMSKMVDIAKEHLDNLPADSEVEDGETAEA